MDMNIGSLVRALMKDNQPADVKALELRVGQIVRGVLIEMLDGQEGLININGVPVRAKLEAELAVGQGTLLQVRPESSSGMIALKPLGEAAAGAQADETLTKEGAKAFGMSDQPWSRDLLRGLARDGYPVTRETADWFKQAAEAMPQSADAKSWMNAAGVAFRRGLQPTETTIGSLRQALYGPPLHEQLSSLTELADRSAADSAAKPAVAVAAQRVGQLLREVTALIAGSIGDGEAASEAAGEGAAGGAGAVRPEENDAPEGRLRPTGHEQLGAGNAGRASAGRADAGVGTAAGPLPGTEPAAGSGADGASASAAARREASATGSTGAASPREATAGAPGAGPRPADPSAAHPSQAAHDASGEPAAAAGRTGGEPWIGKLLNALGANHEHMALKSGMWSDLQGAAGQPAGSAAESGAAQQADSLKSALLGLAAMEDAPQALREAAQNLVQQITGQQLLLSAERQNTAMMSHMTLFIPMKGKDGETTAKVHIEARRGRRGEWDADNCRLLFDLDMRHMGRTVVDVQVVDKSVSLRLLNDRPEVAELIEGARDEAAEGLRSAGYRLMSLTAAPYPERTSGAAGASDAEAGASARGAYAAKPYKGIDYRA